MQNMKDWAQTFWCCGASDGKSWNSPVVPRLERNSAMSTAQLRTVWPQGAAKKKKDRRRGKWDIRVRFPNSDEESNKPFLDDETRCDDGHSIFGTRDSLSPRKIFSRLGGSIRFNSKIVFSWLFVISLVMEAMGLLSPFFVLWTCWHCYSFPWYWPVCTNMLIRDRS